MDDPKAPVVDDGEVGVRAIEKGRQVEDRDGHKPSASRGWQSRYVMITVFGFTRRGSDGQPEVT